jgi:transposase
MTKGNPGNRFSTEVRERAVRMVLENEANYKSRSQAIALIAEKFGCSGATLRDWVNGQAVDLLCRGSCPLLYFSLIFRRAG